MRNRKMSKITLEFQNKIKIRVLLGNKPYSFVMDIGSV